MKEEEHWGSYLVEKDCLCRERENGAMIYFLLAGIVLLRHLFMGWAVLSFIITSFCGLSSNLYHKPNCKSYCVSFSFSSKKKNLTYIYWNWINRIPRHCYTRSKQNQWNCENKAFEFFQVRYSSLKHHFFLVEYFFSKTTQVQFKIHGFFIWSVVFML